MTGRRLDIADLSEEQGTMSEHSHSHSANAQFHDPAHAAEFDRRAAVSDIRGKLAERLIEAMALRGDETVWQDGPLTHAVR
ncbi:MAG: hypothetical protein OXN22_01840, partial [Deltaproteobacteria bacterium]|nr:hypothetical protein [Deltaproteobacteria bacterium]